jgi:hypothetical protein
VDIVEKTNSDINKQQTKKPEEKLERRRDIQKVIN